MSRRNRSRGTGDGLSFFSLLVILILGAALAVSLVLSFFGATSVIAFWIERVALALALIIPIMFSYREAKSRGRGILILWVIAVVLIVVVYVLLGLRIGEVWV